MLAWRLLQFYWKKGNHVIQSPKMASVQGGLNSESYRAYLILAAKFSRSSQMLLLRHFLSSNSLQNSPPPPNPPLPPLTDTRVASIAKTNLKLWFLVTSGCLFPTILRLYPRPSFKRKTTIMSWRRCDICNHEIEPPKLASKLCKLDLLTKEPIFTKLRCNWDICSYYRLPTKGLRSRGNICLIPIVMTETY